MNGEPDLERIVKGDFGRLERPDCALRFNEVFRWAWETWRLAVGNRIGDVYPIAVQIMNEGARSKGKIRLRFGTNLGVKVNIWRWSYKF